MSDRISANEFRESLDRHLSDMKADPWLAQRIIASENGEIKMKKKRCFGLILAVVLLLALTTVAFAVTRLYRVINWQGDVTRTIDPTQTPASVSEQASDMDRLWESLRSKYQIPKQPALGIATMTALSNALILAVHKKSSRPWRSFSNICQDFSI